MSNPSGGKGSAPRPLAVNRQTFTENFTRIFGEKNKEQSKPDVQPLQAAKESSNFPFDYHEQPYR